MELILLIAVILFIVVKGRRILKKWDFTQDQKRFHAEKARLKSKRDELKNMLDNEILSSERARLTLELEKIKLEIYKVDEKIATSKVNMIESTDDDNYGDMDDAKAMQRSALRNISSIESDIKSLEEKNKFYTCNECKKEFARDEVDRECLNTEFIGSSRFDSESMEKKEEQRKTVRRYALQIKRYYQCKFCSHQTEDIKEEIDDRDFWACEKCGEEDVIREVATTEIDKYQTYKELEERTAKGDFKTIQARITKVREKTDYECSNCGHKFSSINSRELR